MAAVFALAWLVLLGACGAALGLLLARRCAGARVPLSCLPVLVLSGLLLAYLIAEVAYEEIYPCVAVDDRYCDFASTQYRNLFGWEF